jgi:putative thioredoxin
MIGNYSEARKIIESFPASPEYIKMETVKPLYDALVSEKSVDLSDDPLEASFNNAINLIKRNNLPAAMDGLIDILRQNKHFHYDGVRKILLGLFEILGSNHPLTKQYQRELSLVLF